MCFICLSDNITDKIIKDRRKEFINYNRTLCESKCNYIKYDKETKMSKCECNIESEPIISITSKNISIFDIPIDTKRLYDNFIGETSSNIEIIKCYYFIR